MKRKVHCAVVALEGTFAASVFGPLELVQACTRIQQGLPELEPCEITAEILSPDGQPFLSATNYRLPVDGGLKDLPAGTVIFVPGFGTPRADRLPGLLEQHAAVTAWLKRQYTAGCTLVAFCSGSLLLAESGLLRNKRATTWWPYADFVRERHPDIQLDADTLFVEDERLLNLSCSVCGLDAALAVIERFIGKEFARLCTKLLVLENRPPSELRYEMRPIAVHNDPLIDRAVSWIRGNLHARLTVDDLLRQVPASRRNLSRRFKSETGEGIQAFIQRMRMDRTKLLLETSSLPLEQIIEKVGYQDVSALARQFKRHTQLTPNQYRQRYRLSG